MSLIGTRATKHNVLRNESGQGVVEYILVLSITVMLIGSFIYQFSTAFRQYANNYFGDYIACLLETGELPGQTAGQCADGWTPFSLANGKTATGGTVGATTGSSSSNANGNSGSNSGSKSSNSSNNSSNNSSSSSSSSSSGSNSETGPGGSSENNSGFGSKSGTRKTTSVASTSPPDAGKGREGLKPIGSYSGTDSESDGGGSSHRHALIGNFGYAGQQQDEERAKDRPAAKAVGKDDGDRLRPPKAIEQPSRAPAGAADDGGSSFTLGNFIRILLIAGILIAIFILFGGQLLAISKGGEK